MYFVSNRATVLLIFTALYNNAIDCSVSICERRVGLNSGNCEKLLHTSVFLKFKLSFSTCWHVHFDVRSEIVNVIIYNYEIF